MVPLEPPSHVQQVALGYCLPACAQMPLAQLGIITTNRGAFFSPYYLFDLLARRHADELDPEGREANRRLLRRPFREDSL